MGIIIFAGALALLAGIGWLMQTLIKKSGRLGNVIGIILLVIAIVLIVSLVIGKVFKIEFLLFIKI